MLRKIEELTAGEFDVLIVGGGAFGAAAAREAALRGLRTALIERADFGSGASAECFRMVHGGIRYLQHGHLGRARASCAERSVLLRIAPHLVHPLPIVIPTYGHGRLGKPLVGAGMRLFDLLTFDRNRGIADPARRIGNCRFLDRGETRTLFPEVDGPGLTGAAVFEDGQMYHPARLVLAFVKAAAEAGATVCNYVGASGLLRTDDRITGVRARDGLGGDAFDIRARLVLNATGPWAERLLVGTGLMRGQRTGVYSRDACLVLARRPRHPYALALAGHTKDHDAWVSRSGRHLFVAPWRDCTLVGVWHRVFGDAPDEARVDGEEVRTWIGELNALCPALELREEEVLRTHCALVPFGEKALAGERFSFGKHSRFIDHRVSDGVSGLVTVIGIRFTNARADAARALELLLRQHPDPPLPLAASGRLALPGGEIEDFAALRGEVLRSWSREIPPASLEALLRNHGTEYRKVLAARMVSGMTRTRLIGGTNTLAAEIAHAVCEESALRLDDVVLRRTNLGTAGHPGMEALAEVAAQMGELLHWSPARRLQEIERCDHILRRHRAIPREAAAGLPDFGVAAGSLA